MDFRLDENQQMYFDMVTKFVKNEIIPFSTTCFIRTRFWVG